MFKNVLYVRMTIQEGTFFLRSGRYGCQRNTAVILKVQVSEGWMKDQVSISGLEKEKKLWFSFPT